MSTVLVWAALAVVGVSTLAVSLFGLRWSRTTSDFYVAGRGVSAAWNGAAIGGEYLSAASFLGIAGLVYLTGLDMLWYPVGYTLGFLVLLIFVAAPVRRSGAFTLPDFAEDRLGSLALRRVCSVLVVVTGWIYLMPQLSGANLALTALTGAPDWVGGVAVTVVVTLTVLSGGMRSLTLTQALHYFVKLLAIAVPAAVLVLAWVRLGSPGPDPAWGADGGRGLRQPSRAMELYGVYSTLLALCLGTMGLPHVVVRFYTSGDGRQARRTTNVVIALVGLFFLFPPIYGALARVHLAGGATDTLVLRLPQAMLPGMLGDALTAVLAGGAFAAFLSTASGLTLAVAGVLDQDVVRPALSRGGRADIDGIASFRLATLLAAAVPLTGLALVHDLGLATTVGLAFALAASTFSPLLVLGVWWRHLTAPGVIAGMAVGALGVVGAIIAEATTPYSSGLASPRAQGWADALLLAPAAWSVPLAFAVTVLVSRLTPSYVPGDTLRTLGRLHTPEGLALPGKDG